MAELKAAILAKQADHLEQLYGGGSEIVKNAARKIHAFSSGLQELEALERDPSPYDSRAEQIRKRHVRSKTVQNKAGKLENSIYRELYDRRQALDQVINQRADLRPRETDAEIRAVLRQMEPHDRVARLNDAIKNKDAMTLSALASGNSMLTGVDDETKGKMLDSFKYMMAPSEKKEIDALDEFTHEVIGVFQTVHQAVKSYQDADAVAAADAQKQQADAVVNKVSQLFEEV